jgi:hypothetical protein
MFDAYKRSVEEHELALRKVTFDPEVETAEEQKDPERAAREREREIEMRDQIDQDKHTVNISDFINEHYLYLPTHRQSGGSAAGLLKAM